MKNIINFITIILAAGMISCNKEKAPVTDPASTTGNLSSLQQFYDHFKPQKQTFVVNGTTGGSFTTPQGTIVTIPPNAFVSQSQVPITGNVNIEFMDLYKKSDMLFADVSTSLYWGAPLKSAGEFFIKASSNNAPVQLTNGNMINVQQPLMNQPVDTAMVPFVRIDSISWTGWSTDPNYQLLVNQTNYLFSMYQFANPADSGTWCNSDNPSFFNNYTQTNLTIHPNDDPNLFHPDVFLVFTGINTMIHVYESGIDFPYLYAPVGLQCTVVAVGVKGGKLYSSFTPITISANQTSNFTLSETTEVQFKAQLDALN